MKLGYYHIRRHARDEFLKVFEVVGYDFVGCAALGHSCQYSGSIIASAMTFP